MLFNREEFERALREIPDVEPEDRDRVWIGPFLTAPFPGTGRCEGFSDHRVLVFATSELRDLPSSNTSAGSAIEITKSLARWRAREVSGAE
jgi:hypothetical protein